MRASIDSARCQGHGRCYELAPGVFEEDDEGYGRVRDDSTIPAGLEAPVRLAEANCPEQAVRVIEEPVA